MKHKHLFMRYPEGREKALTFSFDDGVVQDIRMIELHEGHLQRERRADTRKTR